MRESGLNHNGEGMDVDIARTPKEGRTGPLSPVDSSSQIIAQKVSANVKSTVPIDNFHGIDTDVMNIFPIPQISSKINSSPKGPSIDEIIKMNLLEEINYNGNPADVSSSFDDVQPSKKEGPQVYYRIEGTDFIFNDKDILNFSNKLVAKGKLDLSRVSNDVLFKAIIIESPSLLDKIQVERLILSTCISKKILEKVRLYERGDHILGQIEFLDNGNSNSRVQYETFEGFLDDE